MVSARSRNAASDLLHFYLDVVASTVELKLQGVIEPHFLGLASTEHIDGIMGLVVDCSLVTSSELVSIDSCEIVLGVL